MPSPTHTTGTSTLMWQKSPVHHLTSLHQGEGVAFNEDFPNSPCAFTVSTARDSRPFGFVDAKVSSEDVDAGV